MLDTILENYEDEEIITADGFDDAVIGIDNNSMRLIYSVSMILEIIQENEGVDDLEAMDYFCHSIESSYVGERNPIYCYDLYI
tara:strand:- start:235 stop:483 length:249 start_codon:yes stop_codon:yes gene_type:complete